MSTTTAPTGRRAAAANRRDQETGLTFLRAVHAEWIKLTSLRSSYRHPQHHVAGHDRGGTAQHVGRGRHGVRLCGA